MRWVLRAVVSTLLAASGALWLAGAVQQWWPACRWGRFDDRECLLAQSYPYGYDGFEPWTPIADTAHLEGMALMCLAASVALLPWLWLPRRIGASLAALVPASCIAIFAVASWTAGASGSSTAPGTPITGFIWVIGLPLVLVVTALVRLDEAPPRTNRWRVIVALLVGLSNPLASYVIGPVFTWYVSHDDTPWVEVLSAVFLMVASVLVWPSSRAPAQVTSPTGGGSAPPGTESPSRSQPARSAGG